MNTPVIIGTCAMCQGGTINGVCELCGYRTACCVCGKIKMPNDMWRLPSPQDPESSSISHGYCPACHKKECSKLHLYRYGRYYYYAAGAATMIVVFIIMKSTGFMP